MKEENLMYDLVLLVDDTNISNLVHERIIRKTGIAKEIIAFNNPKKALDQLHGVLSSYGNNILVLLDINMPEMSGFEFLDSASLFPRNGNILDILMVTSSIDHNDMKRGLKNQLVNRYITKPLRSTEILDFVKNNSLLSTLV